MCDNKNSQTYGEICKADPTCSLEASRQLAEIWDEVVKHIILEMLALTKKEVESSLHVHLHGEMVLELARLSLVVSERVVADRIQGRLVDDISPEVEREECLGFDGMKKISETAENLAEEVWLKKFRNRWKPKAKAYFRKDVEKKATKVIPRKVDENHFIPRSVIKRYWASGQHVYRNTKNISGADKRKRVPVGSWGFRKNLYSDYLEAYFGLLEGDAATPIRMLLDMEPLNRPQQEAFVGYVVIQRLRNPYFIESLKRVMIPIVAAEVSPTKAEDDEYMRVVYEGLYRSNDFYGKLASPVLSSRWAIVISEAPSFVLPDVCNVFGEYKNRRFVIMPLTFNKCFISLPLLAEKSFSVVPRQIVANETLANDISFILRNAAQQDYLSDALIQFCDAEEEIEVVLIRVVEELCEAVEAKLI